MSEKLCNLVRSGSNLSFNCRFLNIWSYYCQPAKNCPSFATHPNLRWASIAGATLLLFLVELPFVINELKGKPLFKSNMPESELKSGIWKTLCTDPVSQHLIPSLDASYMLFGLYNMAEKVPSFATGGTLWFMDLTAPDHSMRLPILFALTLWLRFKLDPAASISSAGRFRSRMGIHYAVNAGIFAYALGAPLAMYCYLITSNLFYVVFASAMMDPRVPKLLGVSIGPTSTPK